MGAVAEATRTAAPADDCAWIYLVMHLLGTRTVRVAPRRHAVSGGNDATSSRPFAQGTPVLFRLAPHGGRRWVLDLEPVSRSAGAIQRAKPFRHDAFATQLAGMVKDDRAFDVKVPIVGDARMGWAEQHLEHGLTLLERAIPKVLAVKFKNIEGAKCRGAAVAVIPDEVEYRQAIVVADDGLSIDHA
jgi:hypothetical protein